MLNSYKSAVCSLDMLDKKQANRYANFMCQKYLAKDPLHASVKHLVIYLLLFGGNILAGTSPFERIVSLCLAKVPLLLATALLAPW